MYIGKLKSGFTLIELLVVISIIGVLASGIYANFSGARENAQNVALQSELKELQLALEIYRADNGFYPPPQTGSGCRESLGFGIYRSQSDGCTSPYIADNFSPDFMAELPDHQDAANDICNIWYYANSDTEPSWYKVIAERCHAGAVDAASGIQSNDELGRCPSSCTNTASGEACESSTAVYWESYAVYSLGGQCR